MGYASKQWEIGTLNGIFKWPFLICSEQEGLLEIELFHLKYVFTEINGYPK